MSLAVEKTHNELVILYYEWFIAGKFYTPGIFHSSFSETYTLIYHIIKLGGEEASLQLTQEEGKKSHMLGSKINVVF